MACNAAFSCTAALFCLARDEARRKKEKGSVAVLVLVPVLVLTEGMAQEVIEQD